MILILAVAGCKKGPQFTINGKVTHAEGKTVYLEELLVTSTRLIDSVKVSNKGIQNKRRKQHPNLLFAEIFARQINYAAGRFG